ALEHGPVRVGRGALPGGSGRVCARAQGRVAQAVGGGHRRLLRRRAARSRGRRGARAHQTAGGRRRHVSLGRHRVVGLVAPHPPTRRPWQRRRGQRDAGGRRTALGDLVRERAPRRPGRRGHGRGARERTHARDANRPRGAAQRARAAPVNHALYLLDPDPSPAWAPFAGARPIAELRAGAHLIRERWEAFAGTETTTIFALPHLAGFVEPGVPAVGARRPVAGPALIGSSTFVPRGLAPPLPPAAFRLSCSGVTAVEPGVVFDVRQGPVVLESGVEVRSGTRLEGPLWTGANTHLLGGPIRASAIGPHCKVRGELASCLFLGYANKAHDGFVG